MLTKYWSEMLVRKSSWFLPVLLILISSTSFSAMADEIDLEYKIKAAFLINFMLYIESEEKENKVKNLCLYRRDTFGEFIHQVLAEKSKNYGNLNIIIRYINSGGHIDNCNSVFISVVDMQHINLEDLPKGILIIGETPDFLSSGGMINLFLEEDRVFFEINIDAINESGPKISSQLLKLARPSRRW